MVEQPTRGEHVQPKDSLSDFARSIVTELGIAKTVYRIGAAGPCVVVCHELPGITPAVADFCRHVAAQGFRVSCPVMLGVPGAPMNGKNIVQALLKVCISKEFSLFTAGKSSPIVDWLRAFGKTEHARCGGPGIGVVGMCFSGGFALALATDPHVLAPVMSQPANPATLPFGKAKDNGSRMDMSDGDLQKVRTRLDAEPELCVLAYRFSDDKTVPADRFAMLRERLGERFVGVTFDSSPGNPNGYPKSAHSVLTTDLVPEARDEVVALFKRQLLSISS
jgi:dienelactone hydrolase